MYNLLLIYQKWVSKFNVNQTPPFLLSNKQKMYSPKAFHFDEYIIWEFLYFYFRG